MVIDRFFKQQVEVPSQFMENWLYDWDTIKMVSGHFETGQTLPREQFDQLVKGKQKHKTLLRVLLLKISTSDQRPRSRVNWGTYTPTNFHSK